MFAQKFADRRCSDPRQSLESERATANPSTKKQLDRLDRQINTTQRARLRSLHELFKQIPARIEKELAELEAAPASNSSSPEEAGQITEEIGLRRNPNPRLRRAPKLSQPPLLPVIKSPKSTSPSACEVRKESIKRKFCELGPQFRKRGHNPSRWWASPVISYSFDLPRTLPAHDGSRGGLRGPLRS
jgi:hypothetical protein